MNLSGTIPITNDSANTTLFLGCMFSGKTSALIESVHRHILRDKKCLIVRRDYDTRNPDLTSVNTHFGVTYTRCTVKVTKHILDIDDLDWYDVIAIDEGQFFDEADLLNFVKSYHDKYIIISALNGSWDLKPFASISAIIPYCENIIKLSAVCDTCKERADFSKKVNIIDDNIDKNTSNKINNQIIIGGKDVFTPACYKCLIKN